MYNRGSGLQWNSWCQLLMIYVNQEDLLFRKQSPKSRTCITIERIEEKTLKRVEFRHIEEWSESEHWMKPQKSDLSWEFKIELN